jgi:tetratricopeptide (TPR) repeat protein
LQQSLDYCRRVGDRFLCARILHKFGESYNRQRQHTLAIDHLRQSLQLTRELGISEFYIPSLLGLSLVYSADTNASAEEGVALLRRAYQISQAENNKSDMAGALSYLSRVLAHIGRHEEARIHAQQALAIAEENSLEYRCLQAKMDVGTRAYQRGDLEEAIGVLSEIQDRPTIYRDQLRIETTLALAMAQLDNAGLAWEYLARRLRSPTRLTHCNLPLAVFLFAQAGKYARAVTLLALYTERGKLSYQFANLRWNAKFQALHTQLATALGPQTYAVAWEQGAQLDLQKALTALADELSRTETSH